MAVCCSGLVLYGTVGCIPCVGRDTGWYHMLAHPYYSYHCSTVVGWDTPPGIATPPTTEHSDTQHHHGYPPLHSGSMHPGMSCGRGPVPLVCIRVVGYALVPSTSCTVCSAWSLRCRGLKGSTSAMVELPARSVYMVALDPMHIPRHT